ncbi:MAG TPA: ABC transporter substrate-binding protein [Acidimicrobiales bacterium]|nr:ABC transporter substrate-binding protein [Acidimicrobiales bacterium]
MRHGRSPARRLLGVALVACTLSAACGDDGTSSSGGDGNGGDDGDSSAAAVDLPGKSGLVGITDDGGEPTEGGTLDMAVWFQASSLDPADGNISGVANGTALVALYDVLMRWDAETDTFEPQLAESLESNDDSTEWTLKLRPDVTFSDGTPLDSEAVVYSINRANERQSPAAVGLIARIESMETPDDLTVVFTTREPWVRFPFVLTNSLGLVVSPTAAEAAGDDFATNPVGAGPFTLERFSDGEELVLTARDDYWGGRPPLDEVRFVPVLSGDADRLAGMTSGDFDAGFIRNAGVIGDALDEGYGGYVEVQNFGELLLMNSRDGRPTADPRVREAVALAVDTDDLNERVNDGLGIWSKAMFPSSSIWDTSSLAVDGAASTAEATELLDAAKADGYDGAISILCDAAADRQVASITLEAQLEAVGFDVTIDEKASIGDVVPLVQTDHAYDLACWGNNTVDAAPLQELDVFFNGPSGYAENYGDRDAVQAELDGLEVATDADAEKAAIDAIQEIWTESMPALPLAAVRELVAWTDDVHGIVPTSATMVILSDAWLAE